MKKAQILSALALAFALGVVAPVANTVVSGETYAADTRAIESATKAEVNDAVAKIEGYATYKKFASLISLISDYTEEDVIADDAKSISEITAKAAIEAIQNAVDAIKGGTTTYSTLNSAISGAQKVADYNAYANLYNELAKGADKASTTAIVNYIKAINNDKETTVKELKEIDTTNFDALENFVEETWSNSTKYGEYATLISATNDGNTYQTFVTTITGALNNVQEWTGANKDAVKDAAKYDANANPDPAKKLVDLKDSVTGYDEYKELYDQVEAAKDGTDVTSYESTANRNIINELNDALEAASDVVPGEQVSLDDLSLPAEDGTGEGTNKPGDEAQDPNAPDTGILADAEANASTTVAMVAGIATALTAAGAGVVAYRNARRSTRK